MCDGKIQLYLELNYFTYKLAQKRLRMKLFILFAFYMTGSSFAKRECIYIDGDCVEECEEGTYAYAPGCDYFTPEATCEDPKPEMDTSGILCDYSACYCKEPTVRNKATGKCVAIDNCPNNKKSYSCEEEDPKEPAEPCRTEESEDDKCEDAKSKEPTEPCQTEEPEDGKCEDEKSKEPTEPCQTEERPYEPKESYNPDDSENPEDECY